jgi:hypothetical protein
VQECIQAANNQNLSKMAKSILKGTGKLPKIKTNYINLLIEVLGSTE